MTLEIDWICIKCGEVHTISMSDLCNRCGWKRPMKEETREEMEQRWTRELKENKKKFPKGL